MPGKDPRVDAYITDAQPFAKPVLRHVRKLVHQAVPGVDETIKWGFPHFEHNGLLCGMASFKAHCAIGFWNPAVLEGDRARPEAMGQFGRIASVDDLPADRAFIALVKKAAALNDAGIKPKRAARAPKPPLDPPADLIAALKRNRKAHAAFEVFPPSHRREVHRMDYGGKDRGHAEPPGGNRGRLDSLMVRVETGNMNGKQGAEMRVTIAAIAAFSCLAPATAFAQTASGGNAVSNSIRSEWKTVEGYIKDSATDMDEANYSFKPVDSVRSFGAILAHVAGANYVFCSAAKGEKSPHAEDEFEKGATTRAQIVKALNDSLTYCDSAFAAATDASLGEMVNPPFGTQKITRAEALIGNVGHLNEHYGNLVTYFRIKGMVPPSSRRQ